MASDPVVLFDVDGVLADFTWRFTGLAKERFNVGEQLYVREQPSWEFPYTSEMIEALWREIEASSTFWESFPPVVTQTTFNRINRLNNVYFITSRIGVSAKRQTAGWLEDKGIWAPAVIVVGAGSGAGIQKARFAKVVSASYSIEDHPKRAMELAQANGLKSYLQDRLYNKEVTDPKVIRVNSVEEYLDAIEGGD